MAHILDKVLDQIQLALVAAGFFGLLDSAEFEEGGAAGLFWGHAVGDVVSGFGLDVIAEFFVQFAVCHASAK